MRNFLLIRMLLILCTIVLLQLITSCNKEADIYINDPFSFNSAQSTTLVSGTISDENGMPLSGVQVSLQFQNTYTNAAGFFSFPQSVQVLGRVELKMHKEGYFDGFYAGQAQGESTHFRMLMSEKNSVTISYWSIGNTIELGENAKMRFTNRGFILEDGTPYEGSIKLDYKHFDPADENFSRLMPGGDFRGINTAGDDQLLISYGAFTVDLKTYDGQNLKMAEENSAVLDLYFPEEMESNSDPTVPLWHFNEETMIWEEDGFATKQGNKYVARVNHFSSWNIDKALDPSSKVQGYVKDCEGKPVAGIAVEVGPLITYTDAFGYFETIMATGFSFDVVCNASLNFGLLSAEQSYSSMTSGETRILDDVLIPCPTYINGVMEDCDGYAATGFVVASWEGGSNYMYLENGRFEIIVPAFTEIELSGYNAALFGGNLNLGEFEISETNYLEEPLVLCEEFYCNIANFNLNGESVSFNGAAEVGQAYFPVTVCDENSILGLEIFSLVNPSNQWCLMNYLTIRNEDNILTVLYEDQESGVYTLTEIIVTYNINFPIYESLPSAPTLMIDHFSVDNEFYYPNFFLLNEGSVTFEKSENRVMLQFNGNDESLLTSTADVSGIACFEF